MRAWILAVFSFFASFAFPAQADEGVRPFGLTDMVGKVYYAVTFASPRANMFNLVEDPFPKGAAQFFVVRKDRTAAVYVSDRAIDVTHRAAFDTAVSSGELRTSECVLAPSGKVHALICEGLPRSWYLNLIEMTEDMSDGEGIDVKKHDVWLVFAEDMRTPVYRKFMRPIP